MTDFELITAKITLPSKQEILEKLKSGFNKHLLSITYRPTEKTLVHMMLPHPEIKAKTSTGKNIVFKGTASFNIQLTEVKNELDPRLVNDDSYKSATDAINAFYDKIKFCVQMYGRVQPCVMKWC